MHGRAGKSVTIAMVALVLALISACGADKEEPGTAASVTALAPAQPQVSPAVMPAAIEDSAALSAAAQERLQQVLAAQTGEVQARYPARRPAQTLAFFGIEPGATVVEASPEGGWYSKILHRYLGPDGTLIGADYPQALYELFDYYSDEELAAKLLWAESWPAEVSAWANDGAGVEAFNFSSMPAAMRGRADAVLFVRALHNLSAFESNGAFMSSALADAFAVLKPGGIVGVVQHMGPESADDAWAGGDNGYLKKSRVISAFAQAGFELDGDTDLNENPRDMPGPEDYVWRLPPTLEDADDPMLKARYEAIGESNRMTLRFRKPL